MEKRYFVGYRHGEPWIEFEGIEDFQEETDGEGNITVSFTENGRRYTYSGTVDGQLRGGEGTPGPIDYYKTMGRRTVVRHDLAHSNQTRETRGVEVTDEPEEDDVYYTDDAFNQIWR